MKDLRVTGGKLDTRMLTHQAVVLFAFSDAKEPVSDAEARVFGKNVTRSIRAFLKERSFPAKVKEMMYLPGRGKGLIVVVGLGKLKEANAETVRRACSAVLSLLKKLEVQTIGVSVPTLLSANDEDVVPAAAEGFLLGHYEFDKYKTKSKKRAPASIHLYVENAPRTLARDLRRVQIVTRGTLLARDLENDNSDEIHPDAFVQTARGTLRGLPVRVTVMNEKEIQKRGLNLLYAVGRASAFPPRLLFAEYTGDAKAKEKIALVGKGITFDTGGVNLKPSDRGWLEDMHMDMAGAATALAVVKVAAELRLRVNLVGVMPLAENAIGGNSYKPGSVLRSYAGKSVEVKNTDAEGRLVLADAIAYAVDRYKPTTIIDIATLTGACVVALGETVAGMIANNDALAHELFDAGERTSERLWRLPLYPEHEEAVKGTKADLQNMGRMVGGAGAGVITAAAFLKAFIGKARWAHLDIAGTAMNTEPRDYIPKGGTGWGVRLLVDFLQNRTQ
ncbi:MAG: leucyl aminopeptidase [Candidatus Kerfeldbacteria bacterium]|nr:leucyl aminopeptidase [Candidatus Kerfeldbacteria bacterium]